MYKPRNWQFPWTFQPSPQLRNVEKAGLQIAAMREHSLRPRGWLATPLHNVWYTFNCHAHSWHPGIYWLESLVYSRLLNGTGIYSEPASMYSVLQKEVMHYPISNIVMWYTCRWLLVYNLYSCPTYKLARVLSTCSCLLTIHFVWSDDCQCTMFVAAQYTWRGVIIPVHPRSVWWLLYTVNSF